MKKFAIIPILFFVFQLGAQNVINYKALIKDDLGNVIANDLIQVQFTILEGATIVYEETHSPNTDANGFIIVNIGEGAPLSGDFSTINWEADDHFLNVQVNTGGGLVDMGTTQFSAVPYALSSADNRWKKLGNMIYADANQVGIGTDEAFNGAALIRHPSSISSPQLTLLEDGQDFARLSFQDSINGDFWTIAATTGATLADDFFNIYNSRNGDLLRLTGEGNWGFGVTPQTDIHFKDNKIVLAGSGLSGAGTKMMWLPAYGAFRAGRIASTGFDYWNESNLGTYSFAANYNTRASAYASTAFGEGVLADSRGVFSLGRFNLGGGDPANWVETDPLFEIGNGTSNASRSNALTILKNGTIMAPSLDIAEIIDNKALITKEYFDTNSPSAATGLEALDEGNGIGWRLIGSDPNFYGNIGFEAVDISFASSESPLFGATGFRSFAQGRNTQASGSESVAMGHSSISSGSLSTAMGFFTQAIGIGSMSVGWQTNADSYRSLALGSYNVGGGNPDAWVEHDPLIEIGNGFDFATKSNALTILKNGTITAPSFDLSEITDNKALITKEYFDTNSPNAATGLEALDEGNGIGWRLIGKDPANFGDLGELAIDLSDSSTPSTVNGATGRLSLAAGGEAIASGDETVAMGSNTEASGYRSFVFGDFSVASNTGAKVLGTNSNANGLWSTSIGSFSNADGNESMALGKGLEADAFNTIALGRYNVGGGNPTTEIQSDPLLEVGNGIDDANRSNALTILKNGTITAPSFDLGEIIDNKALITKEYYDLYTPDAPSGLEELNEGNGFGYRLINMDPSNYGDIGGSAVDLSFSVGLSSTKGATGINSIAMGYNTEASGIYSFASGYHSVASGTYSTATGRGTEASGNESVAMGYLTEASGLVSTSFGNQSQASGNISFAAGYQTRANSYASFALGRFNVGGGSQANWISSESVFEIGIGTSDVNRSNALTVLKNGNIGLVTSSPNAKLHISSGADASLTNDTGYFIMGDVNGVNMALDSNEIMVRNNGATSDLLLQRDGGNVTVGGVLVHSSDKRLKKDIEDITYGLEEILQLQPKEYYWKNREEEKNKTLGLIAQEVNEIITNIVHERDDEQKTLSVSYTELIPVLIKAMQEQQDIIDAQNQKLQALESRISKLEQLEAKLDALSKQ